MSNSESVYFSDGAKTHTGVLVAISIPIFTSQLEKAREATDQANLRSAYAQVMSNELANGSSSAITVTQKQTQANWQSSPEWPENFTVNAPTKSSGSWSVAMNDAGSGAVATYTGS